jgi:putative ABC transport system substrate-binding protein
MTFLIKRLALGLLLIAAASGVLLLSDLQWSAPAREGGQLGKKWNLHLISYVSVVDSEEAEQGIVEGLKHAGLVEGTDYTLTIRNAQGDMPTLNGLVQAALTDRADLLFTLSTPGLQAAMRQTNDIPIVFTFVADPIVAGAGKSNTDHKPNVTGVYVAGAYADVVALLRECMPKARKVGTLYVPTEVNTVYHKDQTTA